MRVVLIVATACIFLIGCDQEGNNARGDANFESANSIGRWCAKPSTVRQTWQIIEIIKGPDPVARIKAGDGSSFDRKLTESQPGTFVVDGDSYGANYRLNSADEDIGLYDDQGLIHFAQRMRRLDPPEACLGH